MEYKNLFVSYREVTRPCVTAKRHTRLYSDVRKEPPEAQRLRRDRAAPVVSFRATRMSRERTCPVAHTAKGFALLRQKDYSAFSRMAARHRPEVAVTIGQNVASAKSTRLYLDVRQEPPEAQRLRRDRAAPVVSFRATRMSRERTCPVAHTAKGLALPRQKDYSAFSLAEPKRA